MNKSIGTAHKTGNVNYGMSRIALRNALAVLIIKWGMQIMLRVNLLCERRDPRAMVIRLHFITSLSIALMDTYNQSRITMKLNLSIEQGKRKYIHILIRAEPPSRKVI